MNIPVWLWHYLFPQSCDVRTRECNFAMPTSSCPVRFPWSVAPTFPPRGTGTQPTIRLDQSSPKPHLSWEVSHSYLSSNLALSSKWAHNLPHYKYLLQREVLEICASTKMLIPWCHTHFIESFPAIHHWRCGDLPISTEALTPLMLTK